MFAFLTLSCVLIFVLIYLFARKLKGSSKSLENIPGPKPIFPFGNTLDFIAGPTVFLQTLMNYLDKYGETVVVYDGAFSKILITIDYKLLEYFYSSSEHIDKAKQYVYLHKWLGQGLLTSTGSKWKAHRKVITPSFHFSILKEFVDVFETVGENLIKKLQKNAGSNSFEISRTVSLYALDVICESAMGIKINALVGENSNYIKNIKTMCNIIVSRVFSPINDIFYPLTWNCYQEKKSLKVIHPYVEGVIDKKIKEHNKVNISIKHQNKQKSGEAGIKKRLAFLDMLLEAQKNGQPLSREEIRDEVNTFMFEGHDTTASAISFCLLMLATHPEVQEKTEIILICGENTSHRIAAHIFNERDSGKNVQQSTNNVFREQMLIFNGDVKNAKPSFSQLNEMKYLDCVIKETLRLFPSVPFFGRQLKKDTEFKGVLYPKGLVIFLFPFGVQRNAKYFLEPEKFIPERFQDQSGKLPYSYTPFSAGPRNCIGQKFAMLEMLSIVSRVIRHFELGPAIPEHRIQLSSETILISKNGIRISIKDRKKL